MGRKESNQTNKQKLLRHRYVTAKNVPLKLDNFPKILRASFTMAEPMLTFHLLGNFSYFFVTR